MSVESASTVSLLQQCTVQWAYDQVPQAKDGNAASKKPTASNYASNALVNLLGTNGPSQLRQWLSSSICSSDVEKQQSNRRMRLRPIAAWMRGDHTMDDSLAVISVPRSFGLSTTTGARGDAVSYVLWQEGSDIDESSSATASSPSALPSSAFTVRGVVKVVKSLSTFQQELAALTLVRCLLPNPTYAFYPEALSANLATIPTSIPVIAGSSSSTTFARPYSVSSMSSTNASSTSSTEESCVGGLLLMECAPGAPISEYFKRIGKEEVGSARRRELLDELSLALQYAARALAELHHASHIPSLQQPQAAEAFIRETEKQMRDMLGKLALPAYEETLTKWRIDVKRMTEKLDEFLSGVHSNPGVCCVIHGDAHAGNMLWHHDRKRLTLIDLPTMLAATHVEQTNAVLENPVQGKFLLSKVATPTTPSRLSGACPHPSESQQQEFLYLNGTALAGRDVCHFERKLDSFGTIASMAGEEVTEMNDTFRSSYEAAIQTSASSTTVDQSKQQSVTGNEAITLEARRFFEYRSLMGEITQLVRHDSASIKPRVISQLHRITGQEQILK